MKKFSFLAFVIIAISACKNDYIEKVEPINPCGKPTAYALNIPAQGYPDPILPLDNPLTKEGVMLGRMLFYDKILSIDQTISCASCHTQEHAFTDGKAFSTGVRGQIGKRSSMPLFNLMWQSKFFWDGRAQDVRHQVLMPIQDKVEMDETLEGVVKKVGASSLYIEQFCKAFGSKEVNSEKIAKALEQFMLSIISVDSKFEKWRRGEATFTTLETHGLQVFTKELYDVSKLDTAQIPPAPGTLVGGDCFHCHGSGGDYNFSNFLFKNNGLDANPADSGRAMVTKSPFDFGLFKTPSLKNISVSGPYMHDGRFQTLEQVIEHYNKPNPNSPNLDPGSIGKSSQIGLRLRQYEKNALVAFLKTLVDSTYLNNPEYKSPF